MKEYFPRLDILRFFAFLIVFGNHIPSFLHYPPGVNTPGTFPFVYLQTGDLAVGFFFVLSAFLVTYFFEKEREKNGVISLKHFYLRRLLRIWPLYFLVIAVICLVSLSLPEFSFYRLNLAPSELAAALIFLTGFTRPFLHSSNEMLGVLWAITVEEHFYVLWPVLLRFFRKHIGLILIALSLLSVASRYHYANAFEFREFFTFSTMIYLCIGAAAGIYAPQMRGWITRHAKVLSAVSILGVVAVLSIRGFIFPYAYPQWFIAIDGPLFALCFAALILASAFTGVSAFAKPKNKIVAVLAHLGTISYGLYVYHLVVFTILLSLLGRFGVDLIHMNAFGFISIISATLLGTIGVASVSYRFFEKPFLLLKEKLRKA